MKLLAVLLTLSSSFLANGSNTEQASTKRQKLTTYSYRCLSHYDRKENKEERLIRSGPPDELFKQFTSNNEERLYFISWMLSSPK